LDDATQSALDDGTQMLWRILSISRGERDDAGQLPTIGEQLKAAQFLLDRLDSVCEREGSDNSTIEWSKLSIEQLEELRERSGRH